MDPFPELNAPQEAPGRGKKRPGNLIALGLFALHIGSALAQDAPSALGAQRRAELVSLVRQDCGSCHGMRLRGGLGPALLPASLNQLPTESVVATILHGRPGTAMPPWQRFLDEADARWIAVNLQKGFPDGP